VTEALVDVSKPPPRALIAFDLWSNAATARIGATLGAALPGPNRSADLPGGWRAIRVEPTVWWLSGPLTDLDTCLARLESALGDDGAATDLSGGFIVLALDGPGWREALMFGGVFDAESSTFGPGSTAGTLLHHVAVRYDVRREERVDVHLAPSYAEDLLHHLRSVAPRV
jgi:heterotetrameric sarcosine oxidase gamma subunit